MSVLCNFLQMNSITVLGVRVDDVTMTEALAKLDEWMQEKRVHHIVTVNPEFIMTAQNNPAFADTLTASDMNLPDGANLVRAAQAQGTPLRERVAGTDFVFYACSIAAVCGWKVFLLGGRNQAGEAAAARLTARYPKLKIAGTYEGSPDAAEQQAIVKRINDSGASILFVAYGSPAQDLWIRSIRNELTLVRVAVGIGGAFDFIARRVKRAPTWMQKVGLEWFFRLMIQPWRAKRQWALVQFTIKMMQDRTTNKRRVTV